MTTERYIPGYGAAILSFLGHRTAETHAAFFLPHLRPGWTVLDAGCGPGTITLGLSRRVTPGLVIGIDVEESQFASAREQAERDTLNAEFRRANICDLPFEDAYFDAVFCHAVLQHLGDPIGALVELRRVLKPGAPLGIRAGDMGGMLIDAESEEAAQAVAAYLGQTEKSGGDPYVGRKLARLLSRAGFAVESITASYDVLTEALRSIDPSLWRDFAPVAASFNLPATTPADIPFIALAWCEAIGRRQT